MALRVPRVRLDELLVRRGHAPSREKARALVLAGRVTVPGSPTAKPGQLVPDDLPLDVVAVEPYVGRGGIKLAHALDAFDVDPRARICADIGASTGGFTDCLLQRGAQRVYAIDVGYGQLDWKLRNDPRVIVMERTNARFLESLPEPPRLVTIDASFISLRLLLPPASRFSDPDADFVVLIKPQFEAGRERVGKGGVVRDPAVHRAVLTAFADWLPTAGLVLHGFTASPIRGPAGNVEFFAHVRKHGSRADVGASIDAALSEAAVR
jgi:23S rRNA (cytidine1920-2'-O)/16S rRNA (cytidine1409-2'-O)-methyltransferase